MKIRNIFFSKKKEEDAPAEGDAQSTTETSSEETGQATSEAPAEGDGLTSSENTSEGSEQPAEENSSEGGEQSDSENSSEGEEQPAEENSSESEEQPTDQNSSEGDSEATENAEPAATETSSEEGGQDAEQSSSNADETEVSPEEQEPWLFRVVHKITSNKIFSEIMMFLLVITAGYIAILTYGQVTKKEGSVSFETLYAQLEMKHISQLFTSGNMKELISYVYIERPVEDFSKSGEEQLKSQTGKRLQEEFQQLFHGRTLKLTKIECEYKEINKQKETRLISSCHYKISETEQFVFTLEKEKKNQYKCSLTMEKKKKDTTFQKMNALFSYVTDGYESRSDYTVATLLTDKEKADYHAAASYFKINANKPKKNDTYIETIEKRLKNLENLHIQIDEVLFTNYSYNSKTKEKHSNLIICFTDLDTGTVLVLYQPVLVGLYGYQPLKNTSLCSGDVRPEVSTAIKDIFSY